jgi:hypothetical protein
MSTKRKFGNDDEEFVASFLREVRDVEEEHGVIVEIEFYGTSQREVLAIVMVAVESKMTYNLAKPIVRYRTQFPGGPAKLLSATLFQGACVLSRMVSEYRAAESAPRLA